MNDSPYEGIAIVGMAGRFPGAGNIDEFWDNLSAGRETISFFSDAELAGSGLDPAALRTRGNYVPARGVLKDADCFDAPFFGVHPKEAEVMDPQHRVFLETCWAALECAGYAPSKAPGLVGVFAGASLNTYRQRVLERRPDLLELVGPDQVMLGNEKDYLATRVAYMLGLGGPALSISTACSTSLVAVCQACQSLLTYQCDMALAGGVSVTVPQKRGYYHDEGNIGSADGHTRTFDACASGTAFSNGVAVVVLKRLEDAVRDGDTIYAVVKGAALNNDGSQRVSFGAPGVEGQSRVIAMAHALAGADPATITCVEAHGTATPLGDPIELAGLTRAFRMGTEAKQFCALGSVKTNVGHLDAAAGVTGLIKMALSLHHRVIPPSLHFKTPNLKLDLAESPFYVNAALQAWNPAPGVPRRAGVSAFGTGGTNAHIVLEEAPVLPPSGASRPYQLLVLSAKTAEALERATSDLSRHLMRTGQQPDMEEARRELADTAFTLQTGRSEFAWRRIVACQDSADGAAVLESQDPKRVFARYQQIKDPPVVFMFPGQGAQYAGMGAEIYQSEPVFRAEVDRCAGILEAFLQTDLRRLLFPDPESQEEADRLLAQTRYTQPALFVIEYALARLWMSWGIRPAAMIGHSVGEYVAACLSGVFTLEDALLLVARRAALVQAQPGGAMLAVRLPAKDVLPLLSSPELAVAAINSPSLCVVAGPYERVEELAKELQSRDVVVRHLNTSHAFHSPMMDPVMAPFTDLVRSVKLGDPQIPYISNVTARWITADETRTPEYWAGHVRQAVQFADGVAELMKDAKSVLLEVGPGQTLTSLARQHPAKHAEQTVLASLPQDRAAEPRAILETLGRLWMAGVAVDWEGFHTNERRRRIALPTYSFERKVYWPEAPGPVETAAAEAAAKTTPVRPEAQAVPSDVVAPAIPRRDRLLAAARSLAEEFSGYDLSAADPAVDFLEMGLDSLLLTQASQLLHRKFGVAISFRQLMEELSSLDAIASYLDANLPPEAFAPAPLPAPVSTIAPVASVPHGDALEQLLHQQQQLTNQLLQLLGRQSVPAPVLPAPRPLAAAMPAIAENKSHGPFRPIRPGTDTALSDAQRGALEALISRYTQRTAGSRRLAAGNRPILADPRSVSGFKQLWKDMVYPISTIRSDGSRVWDVDGNEYVDFVMGFGASLFGHRPPFVVQALHEQLDRGFEIGPMHPLAGEVAALLREFTGMQRFGFTNTGSEAVLAATRVSRTVTGRDKIAVFAGAYHGIFDEVLFRPLTVNGETRTAPIAPGIPGTALEQVIVLDWANPHSLEILRARGSEIAAVLVEPVQSRRLDVQPREFLHELRRVTEQTASALIFDEVVTGFRLHPGGAQSYFGVRADLATYGKVIGGGISIGVVAGDPKFMDALDGGQWQYGDSSFPEVGVTFFAGTFVRHPLALAAAKAVLTHLKECGAGLQERLAERTLDAANQLRSIIGEFGAPYELTQFSSLIQVGFPADQKLAGLLFYMLRDRGIHIYENRAFVMTTSHSDADIAHLTGAFRQSLAEMRDAGFLSGMAAAPKPPVSPGVPVGTASATRAGAGSPFPLTEAQKEIWLAAQMSRDAALGYNESLKFDFRGTFDPELFRAAVRQLLERHPILLATFGPDGQWQRIEPDLNVDVPLMDFSRDEESGRERRLAAMIEQAISEPFDLTLGPLLRVGIARLSSEHHVVIWTAHHIVCDGWSAGLLVSELARIYSALKQGTSPDLDAPLSFREYALKACDDSPAALDVMGYWVRQFSELPPPLDIPLDHPRPMVRSGRASTAKRDLPAGLHQQLKRVAGQHRTTMVVILMAGLKTLIYRLSGQRDVVIGLGVADQAISGNSCLVGHCVNLLPIRMRLNEEASFKENLGAVKKSVLDAYDHHSATLGGILRHLPVPRHPGRPPLVEVIFNVDRDPGAESFHGLEFRCERNPKRALHFDLFFNFVEGPHGLCVECDYNTDLYDAATMDRWLGHYQTLLGGIASNPTETLERLPLLGEIESRELRLQAIRRFPKQQTLAQWFEAQVEKTPDAHAVTFQGVHLTYRELNRRANQLAHYLMRQGVGADALVGLLVERTPELLIGILGILKAGGAYLPIDPVYPRERIAFMLEDAGVPVVLTESRLASALPAHERSVVYLDAENHGVNREPETNPSNRSHPDNLAYVIYTSGSTGKPKGTLITHYNVVRLMQATEPWYGFNSGDVWTLFHSHAFDFSVWEIWGALLYGGRLVIIPYTTSRSPEEFYQLVAGERITVLNQTPSAFKRLIQAESMLTSRPNLALRYVIFGGEALDMASLKPWFDRHGDENPVLVNMYGITETTVHVTYRPLSKADLTSGSVIGIPIPDLQVYILDVQRQPVPVGVFGEIYVGGAGVARGYLRREDLTRERFLPDTFSNRPGELLYRSGDLARRLRNGDIEYVGRIDTQVKIRGFRIELREIEAVLERHHSVGQCAVVARVEGSDDKRLIAYVTAPSGPLSAGDLRRHLKSELPDYMVPSAFVRMKALPLTANGKIDHSALPAPDTGQLETGGEFIAPRDPLEQGLAQLWSKILKVPSIGLSDNFFELGGHSLLAVRLVVEIEKLYKKRLPLATFVQAPTLGAIVEKLREDHWTPDWSSLVPVRAGGSRPPLFLMHSHGGNILEYYPLAERLDSDQPVYALQARGLDGNIVKDPSIEEMAEAYLKEIRSLQPEGPYFLGGFCFGGLVALEAAQQLLAAGEEVGLLAIIQTINPTSAGFRPDTSSMQRWWYRTTKRLQLEQENLHHKGSGYLRERSRRVWEFGHARASLALNKMQSRTPQAEGGLSMAYILQAIGIENDKAYEKYRPQPYGGRTVLFRAATQLRGQVADSALGWRDVLVGDLKIYEVPGHQQSLLLEPNVSRLAEELGESLVAAQQACGLVEV